MARETERIEQEIEAARERLAGTLDEIAVRADPQRIADDTKRVVLGTLQQPKVKYSLIAIGALILGGVLFKILR